MAGSKEQTPALSRRGRRATLVAAFLGWLCAGMEMGLGPLAARPAVRDLLFRIHGELIRQPSAAEEGRVGTWFAWYLCAFLLGGAAGGLLFGRLGDRYGRVQAMGYSILCFSVFTGLSALVRAPGELLVLRFLASLGVGGMWPAGVALISEAWPEASRPTLAGIMGTAGNLGILLMALIGWWMQLGADSWRNAMVVGAAPAVLGLFVLLAVPESPRWLALCGSADGSASHPVTDVFRPPLRRRTLLGIVLGAVPLLGTWASGKWLIPWADAAGRDAARTQAIWAAGAVLGSGAGGWLADRFGRRATYFIISVATLILNMAIYRQLRPTDTAFLPAVFLLGLIATVFFGWLPLYLPELFPTRVRATGSGVTYNFGRIIAAAGVLGAGGLIAWFQGDYARVGALTAWVYGLGAVAILFAPDTGREGIRD